MDKTLLLNNGIMIPNIGLGLWKINTETDCCKVISSAIDIGYRLIDTASGYQNELQVGNALKKLSINRRELFITSKLWVQDYGYEQTKLAFQKSLNRLQLDYLDMYMLHWPVNDFVGSWRAMEDLYNEGYIRAIGVCNFTIESLEHLLNSAKVLPVINQVETHPLFQQKEMKAFLKKHNIQHQSWAPLSQGNTELLKNKTLMNIANRHNKSISQIVLRWHIQSGSIAIPKASNPLHLKENYSLYDFYLDDEEMNIIAALDTNTPFSVSPNDPKWLDYVKKWTMDI